MTLNINSNSDFLVEAVVDTLPSIAVPVRCFVRDEDKALDITSKSQKKVMWWHNPIKGPWQTFLICHRDYPKLYSVLSY